MWKPVRGWEGLYEVSSEGLVRNTRTLKLLTGDINKAGYKRVQFYNKPKKQRMFVHRLVAETFLVCGNESLVVNHKDGNKLNNHVDNLEWVTRTENNVHAYKHNLTKYTFKGDFIVEFSDGTLKTYDSFRVCAREIGTSKTNIRNWLNNKPKSEYYRNFGIKDLYYC